jgi:hypothetical protein
MPTLHEKLAASLGKLHKLQGGGRHVFRSGELPRADRERLLQQGFLREVIKGWIISSSPDAAPGDTTPWFASFWEFCARSCEFRFGKARMTGVHASSSATGCSAIFTPIRTATAAWPGFS